MNEYLSRRLRCYRAAFQIAHEAAAEQTGARYDKLIGELSDTEKAYHYAQRYLRFFMPAVPGTSPSQESTDKKRASLMLAFEVVSKIVESGAEALGYSYQAMRYVVCPAGMCWHEDPFRSKYSISKCFPWCDNSWHILEAAEKLAPAIRRVKARTVEEVMEKLFMKEDPA